MSSRSSSSSSSDSIYLSISSFQSFSSDDNSNSQSKSKLMKSTSQNSKSSSYNSLQSWRRSMQSLADSDVFARRRPQPPKIEKQSAKSIESNTKNTTKRYNLCSGKQKIDLIRCGPGDSLVTIYANEIGKSEIENRKSELCRPVYMFSASIAWKQAARMLMNEIVLDGVYFVGICWRLKRVYRLPNGEPFTATPEPHILHCFCKEPAKRFQGRIGPISTFVPRDIIGQRIGGIWVSLISEQIFAQFIDPLKPFKREYRERLKAIKGTIEQVMFFVANDAACVGMQILNTKGEERRIKQAANKKTMVYHHERPLLLQDSYYLLEGEFETTFLNYRRHNRTTTTTTATNSSGIRENDNADADADVDDRLRLRFDAEPGPRVVIIAEGTHLIRTQTEPIIEWKVKDNINQTKKCGKQICAPSSTSSASGKKNIVDDRSISVRSSSIHIESNRIAKSDSNNSNNKNKAVKQGKELNRDGDARGKDLPRVRRSVSNRLLPSISSKNDNARLVCTKMSKIRKIEVQLDRRYERVIALDYAVLQQDFFDLKFDSGVLRNTNDSN